MPVKNSADIGPVAAIILAAGASSRMGQPKQVLPWGGEPLVRVAVRAALAAPVAPVLVVTGNAHDAVAAALADLPVQIVHNAAFAEGQSTSLRAGVLALPADVGAVVVLLGDQPFVGAEIVAALVAAWQHSGAPIVQPSYGGQRGNPVLFDRRLFDELLAVQGDQGARGVVAAHRNEIHVVPFDDERPLIDIDTPDVYEQLRIS